MRDMYLGDKLLDDRTRWSLALILSVLLHIAAFGLGALVGQIVAGQPSNGGCFALLVIFLAGPFVAMYATRN